MHFYLVAPTLRAHTQGLFTYSLDKKVVVGTIVLIEIGRRQSVGVVIKQVPKPKFVTKEIVRILQEKPLPPSLLHLASWLEKYYLSPVANVWQTILPSGLQKNRRVHSIDIPKSTRSKTTFLLNSDQKKAVDKITKEPQITSLLQGITGSGKTAVYIQLAKKTVFKDKRSVVVLVPEIALTSQLVSQFQQYFPNILLTHSGMTEARRDIVWQQALQADSPQLVIGPRSALFLPLSQVGLIILDEAHEPSFKQEQSPRYLASRAARVLADAHGAKLVLGSATPSIVDRFLAEKTDNVVRLDNLAKSTGTVQTKLVDSRKRSNFTRHRFLSNQLIDEITNTLANKQQVLLFHNRRGSASVSLCENCGWSAICPRCYMPFVLHADIHKLICHICGNKESIPTTCPDCHRTGIIHKGIGTKSIAEATAKMFPDAKIARFDGDSLSHETLDKMYQQVYTGEVNIIIGTQVVAKGLDLPNLATVGVIQADGGLILPDFAAEERVFQLLVQVMGRVGRDEKLSTIIVQTYQPEHPAINFAIARNYDKFYDYTIAKRRHDNFPPFTYLLRLTCIYKTEAKASKAAREMKDKLEKSTGKLTVILGPSPAFYERVRDSYRWQIIVKSPRRQDLIKLLDQIPPTKWQIELDPISLL